MPRSFNGTSSLVTLGVGGLTGISGGPITIAGVVKLGDTTDGALLYAETSGGAERFYMGVFGGSWHYSPGGVGPQNTIAASTADNWHLVATTKATGTAAPRGHKYVYDTNTWTRTNAGGTTGDGSTLGAGAELLIGTWAQAEWFNGHVAWVGVWNRALSDAEVEQLPFSLQGILASSPSGLWLLDQSDTGQAVVDWVGTANQVSTANTSVSGESVPVWSYGHDALLPQSVPAAGGSTVDLTSAEFTLTPQALTPVPGSVTVALTAASLTLVAAAVTPSPGAVSVSLTPAALTLTGSALSPVPGVVSVALTPAGLSLSAAAVAAQPGPVAVALTPAALTLSAVPVTGESGPVEVALTPATLAFAAVAVSPLVPGQLAPATLTLAAVALTPVPGAVAVSLTTAVLALAAVALEVGNTMGGGPRITASTPAGRITTSTPPRYTTSTAGGRL